MIILPPCAKVTSCAIVSPRRTQFGRLYRFRAHEPSGKSQNFILPFEMTPLIFTDGLKVLA
jgi:hypothetical protein